MERSLPTARTRTSDSLAVDAVAAETIKVAAVAEDVAVVAVVAEITSPRLPSTLKQNGTNCPMKSVTRSERHGILRVNKVEQNVITQKS